MRVDRLFEALRTARPDGRRIEAWTIDLAEARRVVVGTKDLETGGPHAPLTVSEALNGRYRIVWDDGLVSRGVLERRAIEHDPGPTLAAARASAYEDPDARDVLGPSRFPDVPLHDPACARLAGGDIEPFVPRLTAIRERVAAHGLRTWSGAMQAAAGRARVMTSLGLDVASEGTSTSWSVSFDGENVGSGLIARRLESHDEFLARIDRLIAFVLALRTPAPARPGAVVPVLLHPDVVEEYALGVLLHNLDGEQVAHGTGAFTPSQFASTAPLFREDLALRNDPLRPMAAGAYRSTREGVPAAAATFLERGRLVAPLLDLKYARRLGLPPNAGPAAMDTLALTGPPPLDYGAGLDAAAGGVLVLSVLGVHTQDFTSGDFSLSAPQTLSIGAAGIDGRLRGTISGNLFELLRADDLTFVRFPGETTPGLLAPFRFDPS